MTKLNIIDKNRDHIEYLKKISPTLNKINKIKNQIFFKSSKHCNLNLINRFH